MEPDTAPAAPDAYAAAAAEAGSGLLSLETPLLQSILKDAGTPGRTRLVCRELLKVHDVPLQELRVVRGDPSTKDFTGTVQRLVQRQAAAAATQGAAPAPEPAAAGPPADPSTHGGDGSIYGDGSSSSSSSSSGGGGGGGEGRQIALRALDLPCSSADLTPIITLSSPQSAALLATHLERLSLRWGGNLRDLAPLAALPSLTDLSLRDIQNADSLSPLASLRRLRRLSLVFVCRGRPGHDPLSQVVGSCPDLLDLEVGYSGGGALQGLEPLLACTGLTRLALSGNTCHGVTSLSPLSNLAALRQLELSDLAPAGGPDVHYCRPRHPHPPPPPAGGSTLLQPLAACTALTRLSAYGIDTAGDAAGAPLDLSGLAACRALQELFLSLSSCGRVTDASPLAALTRLRTLSLSGFGALTDLGPLGSCTALERMDLDGFGSVQDLSPLAPLQGLGCLCLEHLGSLADLSPLSQLGALSYLKLAMCWEAEGNLSGLAGCRGLTVDLGRCEPMRPEEEERLNREFGLSGVQFV